MNTAIPLPMEAVADFFRRWRIVRLEVFGSVLREDCGPESDVDFLVTWAPDSRIGILDLDAMENELSAIVGRRVDLLSRRAVEGSENWIRRRAILESAQELYAA